MVFLLAFAMLLTSSNLAVVPEQTVYAASTKIITGSTQVICKQSAMVKAPRGYGNCRFSSSNKKVASVNAKGKLKALRLGVTKITVYSNKKKQSYKITVVPKSDKDVRLKQSLFLKGQTDIQLKLTSNVYDTSQTSVYKGYKQDKIEMRGDRAEMSDFPLYLNTVAGGLDCRDQTIGGFSFVVKIYALPVVEIIG